MREISSDAKKEANYIIANNATIRQAAEFFAMSKSTLHKDVTERLEKIDSGLHSEVKEILDKNKAERHIRGGIATRRKWNRIKMKTE